VPWALGEIWENKLEPAVRRSPSGALERVRATRLSLRKSEAKVADLVLADPARILELSLAGLAALAGVSQPTVMRFCVAIGFSGYQEFKLRLAQSLALGRSATHSVISDRDGLGAVTDKIFEYTLTSLDWARQHLDRVALERAVDLLAGAASITFFGFGASAVVAMDAQQKFPLFDVPSRAEADAHQQIMAASMMREGDVLVVISNTGRTRQIVEAAEIAKGAGAVLIGIVGAEGPISALCDVSLLVETLDNTNVYTPTTSRIAALVLVDILSTAVALRRDSGHLARLSRMKQRLNAFRSGDTEPDTSG
jgi:RpiR family transcriptional regulator, carbohydrate utilization regulator